MSEGSPYAPHTPETTAEMLEAVGVETEADLFDIPEAVRFDDEFGIEARSERETRRHVERILERNDDVTEFLGRGHYDHYVPSVVDDQPDARVSHLIHAVPARSRPGIPAGPVRVPVDARGTDGSWRGQLLDVRRRDGVGEAATLSQRVRSVSGDRVLIPDLLREGKREVLENYAAGSDIAVDTYPMDDGNVDVDGLVDALDDDDVAMVYAENPTVRGTIEERLTEIGDLADDHGALFCLGSDPVALALLEEPAAVGADVVVGGDASTLGTGMAYGMGLGLFVTHEDYLRQVPGRLVGASEDASGRRAYTLTLQTREQHIRRERATRISARTRRGWPCARLSTPPGSVPTDWWIWPRRASRERATSERDSTKSRA